ncbi:MAG: rhombosortase [Candidatus Thiodiazotropha sp.]|nr:rhombosortase [Candidatus Thiodiazotropha sp.]MCM8883868.1 rhombosortase [Candidatus Thiodiazotropha sp.]MCM8919806.1 rhombosortase [Candidatus Thiodiazotropha sp.]MCU7872936.1 rhombosortase [Candidatus Thiodiazotropha sp. (ex Lucinoma borealis)]
MGEVFEPRRFICPLIISLVCLLIALLPGSLIETLQYHRTPIAAGAWWRLISGHLTHLGWGHLSMNLAGFWLIWGLFLTTYRSGWCLLRIALLMLGTSLGLWLFSPEVVWYQGLSGMLHGLLSWAILNQLKSQPIPSLLILAFLVLKLLWEQWQGPMPGSESLASGRVIVDAHLYGTVSGVILWALELLRFARKREDIE